MTDKETIDLLIIRFFNLFTNKENQIPIWNSINEIFLKEVLIIKKTSHAEEIYNLHTFIDPRKIILTDGTLTEFEETETNSETKIIANIAQRWSEYKKSGCLNGNFFNGTGNKFFQFIKTEKGWKISSLIWEDI